MDSAMSISESGLFSPANVGGLDLKNRFVMAPMTRIEAPDGILGDEAPNYYVARVKGGTNLIIGEATLIRHPVAGHDTHLPKFYDAAPLAAWKAVVDAVHAAGGKFMPQIWHEGLIRIPRPETRERLPEPDEPSVSPSGIAAEPYAWARTLEHAEIEQLVEAYVEAGVNAKEIGCDGVEIHGAHGYLIDAFLRAETNRRTDSWGGSLDKRARFAVEIVKGIRSRVGPDFPIVFRFSQWTLRDYNHRLVETPTELEQVLRPLVDAGVTIFHASTRRFWDAAFEGSNRTLSGWAKDVTGLPSISVGSVGLALDMRDQGLLADIPIGGSLDRLEQAFVNDEFDLIGLGRAILANADWPNRIHAGEREGFSPWTAGTLASAVLAAKR